MWGAGLWERVQRVLQKKVGETEKIRTPQQGKPVPKKTKGNSEILVGMGRRDNDNEKTTVGGNRLRRTDPAEN